MILVIDIGNTNIKNGIFVNGKLTHSWRMSNKSDNTSDEYGIAYKNFFDYINLDMSAIEGMIISSVVPNLLYTMEHMADTYFRMAPLFVGPGIKTGISLKYDDPRELGSDRICSAVAAYYKYKMACITIDFGTATTFGAISSKGVFLGGAICPGLKISHDALVSNTARLFSVELTKPERIISRNTTKAIQAGLLYGYVGQVDEIIQKMIEEIGEECKLVATGGMSSLILGESKYIEEVDPTLTLRGLNLLYDLNKDKMQGGN